MSKRHLVTLLHLITLCKDIFDHIDGVIQALARKKTQWKKYLYFAVKVACQKLSKYYAEVTPTTGLLLISVSIIVSFWMLRSFRKWDEAMDVNPEDENSYTTQYQKVFLKDVENEYHAKHRRLSVTTPEYDQHSSICPLQTLLDLGNHVLIHMIFPTIMTNI
jgi:hypothetical protein